MRLVLQVSASQDPVIGWYTKPASLLPLLQCGGQQTGWFLN
ncbi:hypothetical protein [Spirosoma sp. KCTC 42546]|nr:hypothetical protein [Spirosoma sp. KCTC 42546]